MVTIIIKGTSITAVCDNAKDLHNIYRSFGHDYTVIINGEEMKQIGARCDGFYFAGYTVNYFEKFFK